MSIKTSIYNFNIETRKKIAKELDLTIQPKKKFGSGFGGSGAKPKQIQPFLIRYDDIYLPFAYALNLKNWGNNEVKEVKQDNESKCTELRPPSNALEKINTKTVKFTGTLRDGQKQVKEQAISILNSTSSVVLALYPGFGKTSMSIYLASKIGLKTCIVVHRIVLLEQWVESIAKFCPNAKVQVINSKSERDKDADFYIINAINTEKLPYDFFTGIGLLIVDEIHTIVSDVLSRCFFHFQPRFLIGLSATPYRSDGLDVLIDLIFGKNKIIRELTREHIVYKVETGFVPDAKTDMNGKLIWNSVLESQSESVERNKIIIDIISKFKDRYFLVLCKRVSQANYLKKQLIDMGESCTTLIGNNNDFDKSSRILIATAQKAGVGFSHDILNTLIIASDMEEYFVQYLGRVIRTEEGVPYVFDLVDDHPTLKRHFATRKKVYTEAGGKIKKYEL